MEYSVTDVLQILENAQVEKAVAKVKKDFADDRAMKSLKVQVVLKALEAIFDDKATNKSLAKAQFKAGQALIDSGLSVSGDNVFGLSLKGGFLGILAGIGKYAENTFDESDYADIVEKMKLTESSKAILKLGGTIGQIFMNQPDLFV